MYAKHASKFLPKSCWCFGHCQGPTLLFHTASVTTSKNKISAGEVGVAWKKLNSHLHARVLCPCEVILRPSDTRYILLPSDLSLAIHRGTRHKCLSDFATSIFKQCNCSQRYQALMQQVQDGAIPSAEFDDQVQSIIRNPNKETMFFGHWQPFSSVGMATCFLR